KKNIQIPMLAAAIALFSAALVAPFAMPTVAKAQRAKYCSKATRMITAAVVVISLAAYITKTHISIEQIQI
ncbi:MAG: hypothetical protein RMI34_10835, partial [Chloroherpetonaceae bacterium]|nr:hypothetical protein [Chloroherpetonaceae bacterium]